MKLNNRTIRFRAWIIEEEKMHYDAFAMCPNGSFWQYADQGYYVNNLNADDKHKAYLKENKIEIRDEFVLMQYTGAEDINGRPIFEGDIVRSNKATNRNIKPGTLSFVKYISNGFWIDAESFGWEGENLWNWEHLEIVGNVYENPELLPN